MEFNIYYTGDENEASYLIDNTVLKDYRTNIQRLHTGKFDFAYNPDELKDILYLDLPDVVVTCGSPERPVFSVEFCGQKPVGFNIHQRFARLIASADFGIPFAYVFPPRAWVIRADSERWDYVDPRIYLAMLNAMRFHQVPLLAFVWPADDQSNNDGKLIYETIKNYTTVLPPSDRLGSLFSYLNLVVKNFLNNRSPQTLMNEPGIMRINQEMWSNFHSRGGDSGPPSSCRIIPTDKLDEFISEASGVNLTSRYKNDPAPKVLQTREESFIFGTNTNNYRADPYTGVLPVFDYCYCRMGTSIRERYRNLILHFPNISFSKVKAQTSKYHERDCPLRKDYAGVNRSLSLHLREGCRFTKPKELRIYFYFADMVVFKDQVLY